MKKVTEVVVTSWYPKLLGQHCFQEVLRFSDDDIGSHVSLHYVDRTVSTYRLLFIRISVKHVKSLRFVQIDSLQSGLFRNSSYVSLTFPWWSLKGLKLCQAHKERHWCPVMPHQGFNRCQDRIEKLIAGLVIKVNPPQTLSHQEACWIMQIPLSKSGSNMRHRGPNFGGFFSHIFCIIL